MLTNTAIKCPLIHIHHKPERVIGQTLDGLIPMPSANFIQHRIEDRKQPRRMTFHQATNVTVTEEKERPLPNLKMGTGRAQRQLRENRHHYFRELLRRNHIQQLLELIEKHDLLGAVGLGPKPEKMANQIGRQSGLLLQILHRTIGQLWMEGDKTGDLMQGQENFEQEHAMFFAQRHREPVDDAAKDFKDFRQALMPAHLVDHAVEDVVELFADVGAQHEKFAVHPVDDGLEKVTFAGVLAIEELQQLEHEGVVDVLDGHLSLQATNCISIRQQLSRSAALQLEIFAARLYLRYFPIILFHFQLHISMIQIFFELLNFNRLKIPFDTETLKVTWMRKTDRIDAVLSK